MEQPVTKYPHEDDSVTPTTFKPVDPGVGCNAILVFGGVMLLAFIAMVIFLVSRS